MKALRIVAWIAGFLALLVTLAAAAAQLPSYGGTQASPTLAVDANGNYAQQATASNQTANNVQVFGGLAVPSYASLIGGAYSNSPSFTLSNNQGAAIQLSADAKLKVAESGSLDANVGISPAITQAGTSIVGKASPGNLYGAYAMATATNASQEYLVCINATSAPTAGTAITPIDAVAIGLGATMIGLAGSVNYGAGPPNAYSTGITCLISTSLTTYTVGSNAFISVRVR